MTSHYTIGNVFDVWKGGFSCPGEKVAVLVCVALAGYLSISNCQWYERSEVLAKETHPIIYVGVRGTYRCVIDTTDKGVNEFTFSN